MNSRSKGCRGEREAAKAWTLATGRTSRRGQQFSGSPDSPDITDDQIHIEVKRTERLNLYAAMQQAISDSGGKIPIVLHRKNRQQWLVVVELENLAELAREISK